MASRVRGKEDYNGPMRPNEGQDDCSLIKGITTSNNQQDRLKTPLLVQRGRRPPRTKWTFEPGRECMMLVRGKRADGASCCVVMESSDPRMALSLAQAAPSQLCPSDLRGEF